ncbi:uroporphyrinogen decarboxylase [Treponema zuelzerae]|uniref:Uroporphyrinogen decarboxylase n=1 Tax=Teretinema zuelzerae TaxID=156 RepID=A0AAE3EJB1_9SPIR|nr:uroporphyrinogen decarboxylase family protein [Teretinema zuelzerae]MCD1655537.1 uroporphyrinogen decarboxylase [Teretinema zuelzerae]
MNSNKRDLVSDVFRNKVPERTPVGFWFHFVEGDDVFNGLDNPEVVRKNIDGHLRYYDAFKPDLVKLMSDGFFKYPDPLLSSDSSISSLERIAPLEGSHPWIQGQVRLVKELVGRFGSEIMVFYNIFSPATMLRILFGDGEKGNRRLADFILENPSAVRRALDAVGESLALLSRLVIEEGGADGVYVSVQSVQDGRIADSVYREVIAPSDKAVLAAANRAGGQNILHVCGYQGGRNNLTLFADYESAAVNWAVNVEKISLKEGKKLFGGRAVIGGFANGSDGLLYRGSEKEIRDFTRALLAESGSSGVALGADCSLPSDIDVQRLSWVRDEASLIRN